MADRAAHGRRLLAETEAAFEGAQQRRAENTTGLDDDLHATGTVVVIDAVDGGSPLALERLDRADGTWRLLSVADASDGGSERAEVWIADEHRATFLARLQEYATETTATGKPRHEALVATMGAVRHAILHDLWRSDGMPPEQGVHAWELWLVDSTDALGQLQSWAGARGVVVTGNAVVLSGRVVVCVVGTWSSLLDLPFTSIPLAEVRRASLMDSVEDLRVIQNC